MNDPLALKLAEQEGVVAANFLLTGILTGELLTNNMRKKNVALLQNSFHGNPGWLRTVFPIHDGNPQYAVISNLENLTDKIIINQCVEHCLSNGV